MSVGAWYFMVVLVFVAAMCTLPGRTFWTPQGVLFLVAFCMLLGIGATGAAVLGVLHEVTRPDWHHRNAPGISLAVWILPIGIGAFAAAGAFLGLRRRLVAEERARELEATFDPENPPYGTSRGEPGTSRRRATG